MSLNETIPSRSDAVSSGGTDYQFTFDIYTETDLSVYLDGVLQTLNSSYRVRNGALPFNSLTSAQLPETGFIQFLDGGGSVTALASGRTVSILRDQPFQQQSVYQLNESFPSKRVEKDLDKLAMQLQQLEEVVRRCLRAPAMDVLDMTLPSVASRKNNALGFTSLGLPMAVPLPTAGGGDLSLATVLATSSTTARTLAERFSDWVNVKDFRAVGDGVADDTAAIQAALTTGAGGRVYVPAGIYLTTNALTMPSNTWLFGDGDASIIKSTTLASGGAGNSGGHRQIDAASKTNWRITDLKFDASGMTVWTHGMRTIWAYQSSSYQIARVTFSTPGAAVASVGSSYYTIVDNDVTISSTDAAAHHDGIIDQWAGSHHFKIARNTVKAVSIGKYFILVTGQNTDGITGNACHDFVITNNYGSNATQAGIWVNGRNGVNYNFQVIGNIVDTVTGFFGIGIADSKHFTVAENVVSTTQGPGMTFYKESAGGTFSAKNGVISANVVKDANVGLNGSGSTGSAIVIDDQSQNLSFIGNHVDGANHVYAIWFDTTTLNNEVIGYNLDPGTTGTILPSVSSNTIPGGQVYTPTLTAVLNVSASTARSCRWSRAGNVVSVNGRVEVTPTAGSSDTKIGLSLPVASNFTDATIDAAGNASTQFATNGAFSADTTNDRVELEFPSLNTSPHVLYFSFQYTVK